MSIFKDKVLMITGGTGSFGNAVLNRSLSTDIYAPRSVQFTSAAITAEADGPKIYDDTVEPAY